MSNINEIAKIAGVGISSVSRYLNQPEIVTKKTADKIRKAMKLLNYEHKIRRPGRKTHAQIGISHYKVIFLALETSSLAELFRMPAYYMYLDAMLEEFNRSDISLEFCTLTSDRKIPEKVSSKYCDGVVLFQSLEDRKFMKELYKRLEDLPVVWSFNSYFDPEMKFDKVVYDNLAVGKIAADYFAAKKCQRVLVLQNVVDHAAYAARTKCFLSRARQLGMEADTIDVPKDGSLSTPAISQQIAYELYHHPRYKNPDGVFFCSDSTLTAIMMEYRVLGGKMEDFYLLGCNANKQMLSFFDPMPSTIDIKLAGLGFHTAKRLLERINSRNQLVRADQILSPDLITIER